jgi:hypothetical protein
MTQRSYLPDAFRVAVRENEVLELVGPMADAADRLADGRPLCGKLASVSVNPSRPSIRKAFALPIGTTCTPSITCFTAMDKAPAQLTP